MPSDPSIFPIPKIKRVCVCNNINIADFTKQVELGYQLSEIIKDLGIGTKCGTCWSEANRVYKKIKES